MNKYLVKTLSIKLEGLWRNFEGACNLATLNLNSVANQKAGFIEPSRFDLYVSDRNTQSILWVHTVCLLAIQIAMVTQNSH